MDQKEFRGNIESWIREINSAGGAAVKEDRDFLVHLQQSLLNYPDRDVQLWEHNRVREITHVTVNRTQSDRIRSQVDGIGSSDNTGSGSSIQTGTDQIGE